MGNGFVVVVVAIAPARGVEGVPCNRKERLRLLLVLLLLGVKVRWRDVGLLDKEDGVEEDEEEEEEESCA